LPKIGADQLEKEAIEEEVMRLPQVVWCRRRAWRLDFSQHLLAKALPASC
jgi:hypothetical protein